MCVPKEPPKTFAVCTIRQRPTLPIHTLTWGKMLWSLLFGPPGHADNFLDDGDGSHSPSLQGLTIPLFIIILSLFLHILYSRG